MKRLTSTTTTARRCDEWWAIEVPEMPDLFTQTRRLNQVEAMVKDVAQLLDIQIEHISVEPQLSKQDEQMLQAMLETKSKAIKIQEHASYLMRQTVKNLRNQDLTIRDVATIIGVTPQRVSSLEKL